MPSKKKDVVKVDGTDISKLDTGLEDFVIEQVDGASAVVILGKEKRLVRQDDLHRIEKKISAAIQVTY